MCIFCAFAAHEARNAYQRSIPKGAKDRTIRQAFRKSLKRPRAFRFERAAKRFRALAQRFQANLAVRGRLGGSQLANMNSRSVHVRVVAETSKYRNNEMSRSWNFGRYASSRRGGYVRKKEAHRAGSTALCARVVVIV